MKAVRAPEASPNPDDLRVECVDTDPPKIGDGECLIEVHASGVNPSDAKALLGRFPRVVWPRTPGRDYAGIVAEGPSDLIGKEVWGTGGDLGISRNGNHAEFNVVDAASIREKPTNLSMIEAGGIGVSFTCAYLGIVEGARVQTGETVAVLGANGKVGEASIQLATAAGARVIAVERKRDKYLGHATGPVDVVDLRKEPDLRQAILDRTDGRGADVIMNSIGSPYFEVACNSLAKRGRQIIVSTIIEDMIINLRTFYRGNHIMVGVSNADWNNTESAELMEAMRPGFESGDLKAFPINPDAVYGLEDAVNGYKIMINEVSQDRIMIDPRA